MTIATSRPCAGANAVELVAVAVAFYEPLGVQTLTKLAEVLDQEFADELPGQEQEDAQTFAVSADAAAREIEAVQPVTELHSVSRFLAQKDGRFSKKVRATDDALFFECFEYSSFKNFLSDAEKFIGALLKNLPEDRRIREIGMLSSDRFIYSSEVTVENYSVSEIFSDSTKYLTPACREAGLVWHVNQGFFENWLEDWRILQQINISSVRLQSTGDYCSKIEHRSLIRDLNSSLKISTLQGEFSLNSIISKFHESNIAVLKDLLNSEKKKQINLM